MTTAVFNSSLLEMIQAVVGLMLIRNFDGKPQSLQFGVQRLDIFERVLFAC